MTAADLLREVERHGGRLIPNSHRLRVEWNDPLPDDLMERLRQHKPELLRLLAEPSAPCPTCGCGSFWQDADGWHCEGCEPAPDHVTRWRNVSGGTVAPMPAPAVNWPPELAAGLRRVATFYEWTDEDRRDFVAWASRSREALGDASHFLRAECDKLMRFQTLRATHPTPKKGAAAGCSTYQWDGQAHA